MEKLFWEYYHPTQEEIKNIKEQGVYIFDACSLLKLYTLPNKNRSKIFKKLQFLSSKNRVWMTNQNCKEYHNCRLSKIKDQYDSFQRIIEQIERYKHNLSLDIGQPTHPFIDVEKLVNVYKKESDKGIKKLLENIKKQKGIFPDFRDIDPIRKKIEKIFKDKIGDSYTENELEEKLKLAEERKKRKKKPGTSDESHGDTLSWFQLIDFAKQSKFEHFVFVTEEKKTDYFDQRRSTGNILPAAELIKEFYQESGKMFYIINIEETVDSNKAMKIKNNNESKVFSSVIGSNNDDSITNN